MAAPRVMHFILQINSILSFFLAVLFAESSLSGFALHRLPTFLLLHVCVVYPLCLSPSHQQNDKVQGSTGGPGIF